MTTKKTALKIVSPLRDRRREHERGEHDRDGAAEAGPAEQSALAVREVAERRRDPDGGRPDHEHEKSASARPASATAGSS